MFGPKQGVWWLKSESDARWNASGVATIFSVFSIPEECKQALEKLKQELGVAPEDLEWGCMKD